MSSSGAYADHEDRTEPPSRRSVEEARAQGRVASSDMLAGALHSLCALGVVLALGGAVTRAACDAVRVGLAFTPTRADEAMLAAGSGPVSVLLAVGGGVLVLVLLAALVARGVQTRGAISPGVLCFRAEAFDPARNASRALGLWGMVSMLARGGGALGFLLLASWLGWRERDVLARVVAPEGGIAWGVVVRSLVRVVGGVLAAGCIVGIADYVLRARVLARGLRMTREESRREQRSQQRPWGAPRGRTAPRARPEAVATQEPVSHA